MDIINKKDKIQNKEKTKIYRTEDFRKRFTGRAHGIQGVRGKFSVVVPVIEIDEEAHLLYELRSSNIDRQPDEVCFPGGEIEQGETPQQAAIRELREETGIREENVSIITELDTFHPPSGIVIYPFLTEISREGLRQMFPSPDEVAECFLVPVSFLETEPYVYRYELKHGPGEDFDYRKVGLKDRNYNWRPMKHEIISWKYDGKYIWGLTAQITKWTLDILKGERD